MGFLNVIVDWDMTRRLYGRKQKIKREPRIETIHRLQNRICYLCVTKVPHPRARHIHHSEKASLDHVVPKRPINREQACIHIRKNGLVSHHGCNTRKANRMPYPCELIFLEYINMKLEEQAMLRRGVYVQR